MNAYIRHIEYYLPTTKVSNSDLQTQNPEWKMDQVYEKTGVQSRHIAAAGESATDLAAAAIKKLFAQTALGVNDIDALIVCTQSPDYIMPPNSSLLHGALAMPKRVAAFDFNLACSGYVYGLAIAKSLMHTLGYKRVLLVTADTYSKYIHPKDRSTRTVFGDGSSATLLEMGDGPAELIDFALASDGSSHDKFIVKAGGLKLPKSAATAVTKKDVLGNVRSDEHIYMNGKAILEFTQREVPAIIKQILDKNNLTLQDLDLVLLHQASRYALSELNTLLALPPEKTFTNIEAIGNTVSSSLPILLKDAQAAGKIKSGSLVLLVGFGVGLSWGACLLRA